VNDRTLRQRLVPEIGDEGQARIATTTIAIDRRGLMGDVLGRYVEHAGFAEVRERSGGGVPERERSLLADALSRDVLAEADPAVVAVAVGAALAVDRIRAGAKGEP